MLDYMKGRGIRAGVLALAKDGQIIFSRGYGYVDKGDEDDPFVHDEDGPPIQPDALMRIASVTKPITAAAVRQALKEEGLDTDEPAVPWVDVS